MAPAAPRLADRRRLLLTLGAPYALLLLASLVEWPWRALGAPGVVGALTPPSFILLAFSVGASTYALRRKLPLSMITWLPAGQGAIVLLATGFFAGGAQDQLTGLAFIIAYGFIFLIVLAVATAIASNGAPVAVAFVAFFALDAGRALPRLRRGRRGGGSLRGAAHARRFRPGRRRVGRPRMARPPSRRGRGLLRDAHRALDRRAHARARRASPDGKTRRSAAR